MSHDEKRSASAAIRAGLDFPVIDTDVHTNDYTPDVEDYVATYAGAHLVDELRKASVSRLDRGGVGNGKNWYEQTPEDSVEDIKTRWVDSFFFGSEADDRTVAHAFNDKANPLGVKINAIYSSDVGHWDVPDLREVLAESWALVQDGVISEADFRAWTFENPYRLYTDAKADFFAGTAIEEKLKQSPRVAAE